METVHAGGAEDFDFLVGEWKIENRVLKERLANCTEWEAFSSRLFGLKKFLAGNLNIDHFSGTRDGKPFEASSIRVYHPVERVWRIYWVDSERFEVIPQVTGSFRDGIGVFYGEDQFRGQRIPLRFLWKDVSATSAVWEQAYREPNSDGWETNWVMNFRRIG